MYFIQIVEVRLGPTATMPTNNSRVKTILSCRRDVISTLPAHFFSPTAERFRLQKPSSSSPAADAIIMVSGATDESESNFVELELVGSNVRLRLGEYLSRNGWTLTHSDMSSSSCGLDAKHGFNYSVTIELSYRDRWSQSRPTSTSHP